MEKWKTISSNTNYVVSDTGKVKRVGKEENHSVRCDHRGYLCIDLYKDGKRTTRKVHRLVAEAFLPNDNKKAQVNHKDGNKLNNNVSNLEWVTSKENVMHSWNAGLSRPSYGMKGKKNPNAGRKGKPFKIVETGKVYETELDCAKEIEGSCGHINDCLRGRQRTHRGYHFEYID